MFSYPPLSYFYKQSFTFSKYKHKNKYKYKKRRTSSHIHLFYLFPQTVLHMFTFSQLSVFYTPLFTFWIEKPFSAFQKDLLVPSSSFWQLFLRSCIEILIVCLQIAAVRQLLRRGNWVRSIQIWEAANTNTNMISTKYRCKCIYKYVKQQIQVKMQIQIWELLRGRKCRHFNCIQHQSRSDHYSNFPQWEFFYSPHHCC